MSSGRILATHLTIAAGCLLALVAAPHVGVGQTTSARELPLKHAPQPTTADITPADLMTRLYIFSDDSMEGRRVGTEGHRRGTAYIEREVRKLGLVPAGDSGGYFQNLPVIARAFAAGQTLSDGAASFRAWTDFLPRDNGQSARANIDAPVVFGGFWGDTATMISPYEAAGKFIIIDIPNGPDGEPRWQTNRPALSRYYAGAAGIAIASLDAMDPETRGVLAEPLVGLRHAVRGKLRGESHAPWSSGPPPAGDATVGMAAAQDQRRRPRPPRADRRSRRPV